MSGEIHSTVSVPPTSPLAASTPGKVHRPTPPPMADPGHCAFTRKDMDDEDNPFIPNMYTFNSNNAKVGAKIKVMVIDAPVLDFFQLIFNVNLVAMMVEQTNKFFPTNGGAEQASQHSPMRRWTDKTADNMLVFLALFFDHATCKETPNKRILGEGSSSATVYVHKVPNKRPLPTDTAVSPLCRS